MTKTVNPTLWWAVAIVLLSAVQTAAVEVLDPDYQVEEYVTIEGPSFGMTFDDTGNLYVLHRLLGRVTKVTPGRQVSVLTTIPPKPGGDVVSLIWAGGSVFGDFLYAFRRHPHSDLVRIDPQDGAWTPIASIVNDCGTHLGLDRVGLYGGHFYSGTGCNDRIFQLTAGGSVSVFSSWPYGANGGGPRGIDFDPSGRYGGYMYLASAYASYASHVSGLFRIDGAGNVTRFADAIVLAHRLLFAPAGPMFDQEMFVYGRVDYSSFGSVWRVSPDGSPEEFVRGIDNVHPNSEASHAIAFGTDGALYVAQHFPSSDLTTIHRIHRPPRDGIPVALCSDVTAVAGPACVAEASVDAGSYDPDGDGITLTQEPPGPYGLGVTGVELTVSDGLHGDTCQGTVTVRDDAAPFVACNAPTSISPWEVPVSFTATATDNCGVRNVFAQRPSCHRAGDVQSEDLCSVVTRKDTLTVLNAGRSTEIRWLAKAFDQSGNRIVRRCSVDVVDERVGRCVMPPSGMISWWPFDTDVGGIAKDIIGSNDGESLGPLSTPGRVGNALQFDGIDDYVLVAPDPSLELTSMTLETWVRPDSLGVARIFSKFRDQQYLLQLDETPGAIEFTIFWATGSLTVLRSAARTVTVGEWQHIAATYDGVTMKVYYNGRLEAEVPESRQPVSHRTPFAIGTWYSGREAFEGLIDEPAIYDRALSASEIEAIYLARRGKCKVLR